MAALGGAVLGEAIGYMVLMNKMSFMARIIVQLAATILGMTMVCLEYMNKAHPFFIACYMLYTLSSMGGAAIAYYRMKRHDAIESEVARNYI